MSVALHLTLVLEEDVYSDDADALGELIDVLTDHIANGQILELRTGESGKADYRLDDTGSDIPVHVEKVGFEMRED